MMTVMWVPVIGFCIVVPFNFAIGYCFQGPCCLHLQGRVPEDRSSMVLQNAINLPHHYTVSQPRRPQLKADYLLNDKTADLHFRKRLVLIWPKKSAILD